MNTSFWGHHATLVFVEKMGALEKLCLRALKASSGTANCCESVCSWSRKLKYFRIAVNLTCDMLSENIRIT